MQRAEGRAFGYGHGVCSSSPRAEYFSRKTGRTCGGKGGYSGSCNKGLALNCGINALRATGRPSGRFRDILRENTPIGAFDFFPGLITKLNL
jgi:hypothetical protein